MLAGETQIADEWDVDDESVFSGAGEVRIDLSRARIGPTYPRLTVFCGMGDIHIKLPPDVPVLVNGMNALGERDVLGHRDDGILVGSMVRDVAGTSPDDASVLTIMATCLVGEVEIERHATVPGPEAAA